MKSTGLASSIAAFSDGIRIRRLFREDENIVGNAWFWRRCEDPGHLLANIIRLVFVITMAPFSLLPPSASLSIYNLLSSSWDIEAAVVPETILSKAPAGGTGRYAETGGRPRFMLKIAVRNGDLVQADQVPWLEEMSLCTGYTAISYPMKSARVLYDEAGGVPIEKAGDREYGLADRKAIAKEVLIQYAKTKGYSTPDFDEYIWLDEFCLSDDHCKMTDEKREEERGREVGRLADIFRGADQVCVFCDALGCDHTSTDCLWGKRLFTLAEILHTNKVVRMMRSLTEKEVYYQLVGPTPAHIFRHEMQAKAALAHQWHLYAIMQHSVNSGAIPWQTAIHSLIVEVVRRDEAGGFFDHKYLGKALNGLLPRRACLDDLRGKDGWRDLAWLLELNQGFYNASALAAVCSLWDNPSSSYGWLGCPLKPLEGNERLEPIATAFPVDVEASKNLQRPALCVVGAKAVGVRHEIFRDPDGLWHNEELSAFRKLLYALFCLIFVLCFYIGTTGKQVGWILIYIDTVVFSIFRLLAGTAYVKRDGWVFVYDAEWGGSPQLKLGEQDRYLRDPTCWGHRQMAPVWDSPGAGRRWAKGTLIDLKFNVYTSVTVVDKPNSMATLAIHGCGITCMLLNRPDDAFQLAQKVGMVNMPSYVLAGSFPAKAVYVA